MLPAGAPLIGCPLAASRVVGIAATTYTVREVRGGRDDRRGASVCARGAGNRPESSHRRTCRGGKSGLQRARWWVTPTVRGCFTRPRIGKVPQKINRLGRGACTSAAVRVKR